MKTLLRYAELPSIRFHDLRHTFATHAIASGVDAKTLSGILGHTNASFTLDTYTHVTSDMQKSASAVVGNMLKNIMVKILLKMKTGFLTKVIKLFALASMLQKTKFGKQ